LLRDRPLDRQAGGSRPDTCFLNLGYGLARPLSELQVWFGRGFGTFAFEDGFFGEQVYQARQIVGDQPLDGLSGTMSSISRMLAKTALAGEKR